MITFRFCKLFVLALLIGFSSCADDEAGNSPFNMSDDSFKINVDLSANNLMFFVTDSKGVVLFDTVAPTIEKEISIDKLLNDKVNLTYGYEILNRGYFNFKTYRNVSSGFKLSNGVSLCPDDNPLFKNYKNYSLEIKGISEFERVYIPDYLTSKVEKFSVVNKIEIIGSIFLNKDGYLTIEISPNVYLSKYIQIEDWIETSNSNLFLSLDISDFETPEKHEILLDKDDDWLVNMVVETKAQRRITFLNYTGPDDLQAGNKIHFFMPPALEVIKVELEIRESSRINGYHVNLITNDIPTTLTFYDPEIEIVEANSNNFDFNTDSEYDFAVANFYYRNGNVLSNWQVYSDFDSTFYFDLPIIPTEILDETMLIKNIIDQPIEFSIKLHNMDELDNFNEIYYKESIDRHLKCLSYQSNYVGIEF